MLLRCSGLRCLWLWFFGLAVSAGWARAAPPDSTETRRYAVEVAGIRVGTLTAVRQPQAGSVVLYTLVSDVKVNLLVYRLVVYYKVTSLFREGMLFESTVQVRSNRGDFTSRTEWKGDHYDIVAEQYGHSRRVREPRRIDATLSTLYFAEPPGERKQVFSEYFGDYFALTAVAKGRYLTRLAGREDEYRYENGQLTRVVKKNSLKNFVMRLVR